MNTIKIEVPDEIKSTTVSKLYNFCPLCKNLGVILDEGCCIECWETKILPGK